MPQHADNESTRPAYFPHRRNIAGGYDSICLTCFQTVAYGKSKDELDELDERHVCSAKSMLLSQRRHYMHTV